jgi:hypothetical protein
MLRHLPFSFIDTSIDTSGYTSAIVDELSDKTRQAVMENFDHEE